VLAALAATAALACSPHPGLGSVTYRRGGATRLVDLATCRQRTVKPPVPTSQTALASADGRFRAVVRASGKRRALRNTIVVDGRPAYSVKVTGDTSNLESRGPIELLGWSGDDRWIFFAIDPGSSSSIAADGLVLRVVSRAGGKAHAVTTMLAYPDYLTWCGRRLVFTAGRDRIATNTKRLLVASPPDWRARPLLRAPSLAFGSVACAPDGRSVVVQSQRQSVDAGFFATHWALWRVGLDGSRTRLTSPPAGFADESPRFSPNGRTMYFVRSHDGRGRLYALRRGRVIGPLLSLGRELGFYGHRDWPYAVSA
jgi:hypothetical protein